MVAQLLSTDSLITRNRISEYQPTSGVAQKYGYIAKMIFAKFNGHVRGYKCTQIYVQHHQLAEYQDTRISEENMRNWGFCPDPLIR